MHVPAIVLMHWHVLSFSTEELVVKDQRPSVRLFDPSHLLIHSSMQIIHTYVNRLRGRMDDVTDMLF